MRGKRIFIRKLANVLAKASLIVGMFVLTACSVSKEEEDAVLYVEPEKVVAGLEWNMTSKEVQGILETRENYSLMPKDKQDSNFVDLYYEITDYQGIDGVNGYLILSFEEDKLYRGTYMFNDSGDVYTSGELIDQLAKSTHKCYKDSSEKTGKGSVGTVWNYNNYYRGNDSLIQMTGWVPAELSIEFMDVNNPYTRLLIEEYELD